RRVASATFSGAHAGLHDVRIRAAAAEVSGDGAPDVVLRRPGVLSEKGDDRHDLAGGAETALECVRVDEGALYRMQLAVLRYPFDRLDGLSLAGDGERHARIDGAPVDEGGAGATRSLITDLLRPGEGKRLAQRVEKRASGRSADRHRLAVHDECDIGRVGTAQHGTPRGREGRHPEMLGRYAVIC